MVLTKNERIVIAVFAIAGLLLPFSGFPLFWLAQRDNPLITFDHFYAINGIAFPGARGVFLGLTGPGLSTHQIVMLWLRALTRNVIIYTAVAGILLMVMRITKRLFRSSAQTRLGA